MYQKNLFVIIKRNYKNILLVLVLVSLLIDFVRMQVKKVDLNDGQTKSWWEIAYNVENGEGYKACNNSYIPNCAITEQYTAMREPLPILLFALVGKISNNSLFSLLLLIIIFYLVIFLGVFLLGNNLGGAEVGLLSLFLWTFYVPQERIENRLTGDLLSGAFVTLGFVIFTQAVRKNRLRDWLGFGFVMGLAVLSRSALLIVAVTLVFGYIIYFRDPSLKFKSVVGKGLLSLVILGVTLSPWVVRNYIVFRQPVIGTTLIGYNLYRHNAIVATDAPSHYVGPEEARQQIQALISRHPELQTPIDEAKVDAIFREEAVKLILENPVSYVRLVLYRFLPLWFNIGIREQYNDQMSALDYLVVLQQLFLLVVFVLGLWRGNKLLRLFGLSFLAYSMSYLTVGSQLRYLIPLMPIVIVISSIGIAEQWRQFSERNKDSWISRI